MTAVAEPTALQRMLTALNDADHVWTQAQVLHLVSLAIGSDDPEETWEAGYEAGYRARVAEENAAYPPAPYGLAGPLIHAIEVEEYRRRAGVDRRYRRRADYRGGPVEVW